jgi:uncharacterized protein (TIGR02246 family)
MIRLTPPAYLMLFFTACCIALGHESSADETEAVAARVQAYLTAFNRRDIDACAEHWSENAEYVAPASGARVRGRKAIREALQKLLGTDERFKLTVSDQRFRQVSRDVVLNENLSVQGGADRESTRLAVTLGDQDDVVIEMGLYNVTEKQSSALVHYQDGTRENWLLVKMPDPQGKQAQ